MIKGKYIDNLTNNQIVEEIYKDKSYRGVVGNIITNKDYLDDIFQECIIIILEYDNERLNDCHSNGKLRYLFATIARRLFFNKYSNFNKQYNYITNQEFSYDSLIEDGMIDEPVDNESLINNNQEDVYNSMIKLLDHKDLHWYSVELFKQYYKIGEYDKITGTRRDLTCDKDKSSYRKMEKRLGIDFIEIRNTVHNLTLKLRELYDRKSGGGMERDY